MDVQSGEGRLRTPLLRPSTASSRPTTASSFSRPSTASSGERSYQSYDAATIVSTMHVSKNDVCWEQWAWGCAACHAEHQTDGLFLGGMLLQAVPCPGLCIWPPHQAVFEQGVTW